MIPAFLEVGSPEYILLLLVFLVLVGVMYRLGKKRTGEQSRAEDLKKTYAHLTRAMLDELPDDKLVEAVVANLTDKADDKVADPFYVVMALSRGRRAVYSVWLTVNELARGSLRQYRETPSARFAEPALDGLRLFGAEACATILENGMAAEEPNEVIAASFRDAIKQEKPLELAAAYIRDNPDAFTDDPPAADEDQSEQPEHPEHPVTAGEDTTP